MILDKPIFNEALHTYTNQKYNYEYISATTLIGLFKQPFNTDFWSLYNAGRRIMNISDEDKKKYSSKLAQNGLDFDKKDINNLNDVLFKVLGIESYNLLNKQQEELANWKITTDKANATGTEIHKGKEDDIIRRGIDLNHYGLISNVGKTNQDILENLFLLEDGVYPELRLWHNGYKVAGTSDKVTIETIAGKRFIDIDDYKTNKKIDTQSYYNEYKREYTMMQYPVNNLQDCKFIHYSLQTSLYAYLLECFGFVVRNIKFTHLVLNEDKKIEQEIDYNVNYLRSDVVNILNCYQKSK